MLQVTKYIEAINMCPPAFKTLDNIRLEYNENNDIFFYTGSNSVIFRVKYKDTTYALKCFMSPNSDLSLRYKDFEKHNLWFAPKFKWLDEELGIIIGDKIEYFPVLMWPWVCGETLDRRIRFLASQNNVNKLNELKNSLLNVFIDLKNSTVIHNDIKPENIIVDKENNITIIDWDSYYAPSLKDLKIYEIGTPGYTHPLRKASDYGKCLDDYPIAIITVSFCAIVIQPELCEIDKYKDFLLLSPTDIIRGRSVIYRKLLIAWCYVASFYKILDFLKSDEFEFKELTKLITRIAQKDKFNPDNEVLIDKSGDIRRIYSKATKTYGYIDKDDNVIIDTIFGFATIFCDNIAGVRLNNNWIFINKNGLQVSEIFEYIDYGGENMFMVKRSNKWGYYCVQSRKITIEPKYTYVSIFSNSFAIVSEDNVSYEFINKECETQFGKSFEKATPFDHEGISIVKRNNLYFKINTLGERVSDFHYNDLLLLLSDKSRD